MLEIIYLCLLVLILLIEFKRKKKTPIDFLTLFNIGYILWYPFPAFLTALNREYLSGHWIINLNYYTNNVQTALAIFLGYFLVVAGFYSSSAQKLGKKLIIKSRSSTSVFRYALLLLLFVYISILIFSAPLGGVSNAISRGLEIRSGRVNTGSFGFFQRFFSGASFASYLLAAFVFTKNSRKGKIFKIVVFFISVIITLLSFMLRAGRTNVIFYCLGFYQIYTIKSKKISLLTTSLCLILASLFLFFGKNLFFSLSALPQGIDAVVDTYNRSVEGGSANEGLNLFSLMDSFNYTVFSLDMALHQDYELRLFTDLYYGFISLLPSRLLGIEEVHTILYYNSVFLTGGSEVNIPTGFLAFGIYSMSWSGLIIVCLVYGWVGGYLQCLLEKHLKDVFWMPFFYPLVAQIWVLAQSADPETFFQSNFILLISSLIMLSFGAKVYPLKSSFENKNIPQKTIR
jgi:oligosaccharide repeat unit polymerase